MNGDESFDMKLKAIAQKATLGPSITEDVMNQIEQEHLQPERVATGQPRSKRRLLMHQLRWVIPVAAAATVLIVVGVWPSNGSKGAQEIFAVAIDGITQARTFSCKEVILKDGQKHFEQMFMFKEPDRERHVYLAGVNPEFIGDTTITHYGKRLELMLRPSDKTGSLYDLSTSYVINPETGEVELTQLNTSLRDQLLSWRDEAAEDLGEVELKGRSVRLLQAQKRKYVIKVWVDPQTDLPVQIEIVEPKRTIMYTSIQMNQEMDDDLFSLELPEDYTLYGGEIIKPHSEYVGKMVAKMMYLLMKCYLYEQKTGEFPAELADLKAVGVTDEVLKTLLAAPDQPDGPAVIRYRKPQADVDGRPKVMLYEAFDQWPEHGAVLGFTDGHCETFLTQERYEELMR